MSLNTKINHFSCFICVIILILLPICNSFQWHRFFKTNSLAIISSFKPIVYINKIESFSLASIGKRRKKSQKNIEYEEEILKFERSLNENVNSPLEEIPLESDYESGEFDDESFKELKSFLSEQFLELSQGKPTLSYTKFINWEQIQILLENKKITMENIEYQWLQFTSDISQSIDFNTFFIICCSFDNLFETEYPPDFDPLKAIQNQLEGLPNTLENKPNPQISTKDSYLGDIRSIVDLDPWEATVNITSLYSEEALSNAAKVFYELGDKEDSLLDLENLMLWDYVVDTLEKFQLEDETVTDLWARAIKYQMVAAKDHVKLSEKIHFESFLRWFYAFESKIFDIKEFLDILSEEDFQNFYLERDFLDLVKDTSHKIVTFDMLINWEVIQNLIENKLISSSELKTIWGKYNKRKINDTIEGLDLETFTELGKEVDKIIRSNDK